MFILSVDLFSFSSPSPPLPYRVMVGVWQEQESAQETEIAALLISNAPWNFRGLPFSSLRVQPRLLCNMC